MSEAEAKAIARIHSNASRAHAEKLKATIATLEKRIAELEARSDASAGQNYVPVGGAGNGA